MLTTGEAIPKPQPRGGPLSYPAIGLLVAAASVAGFGPTYYFRAFFDTPPLASLVQVHAAAMTCWLALFVTQSWLISGDRIALHRRLGVAGGVLALAIVILGYQTAIAAARHGFVVKGGFPFGPLGFLAISLADLVVFAALVAAALYFRWSKSDSHKRLMLLATASLIAPGISRLPSVGLLPAAGLATLAATVLPVICAWIDRRAHGRLHPAYLWGGGFLVLSQPARGILAASSAWQQFAAWLTS